MTETRTTDVDAAVEEAPEEAVHAARNKKVMAKLVGRLSEQSKVKRARAAKLVHDASCLDAERLEPHIDQMLEALDQPESQTRWETLGALEEVAKLKPMWLDRAIEPTTHCLHDEDSSVVRLAAFRVLAIYGASSKRRAEKVWPLLDEALRCYHGDSEYPGMLTALAVMIEGKAPAGVMEEAALLVEPDASHPKAAIARGARRVFAIATDGRTPRKRKPGGMAVVEEPAKRKAASKKDEKKPAKAAKKASGKPAKQAPKKSTAKKAPKKSAGKAGAKKAAPKKSAGKTGSRKS